MGSKCGSGRDILGYTLALLRGVPFSGLRSEARNRVERCHLGGLELVRLVGFDFRMVAYLCKRGRWSAGMEC